MTEKEFLAHKEEYVSDVLNILERRAEDEASLIFRRRLESGGKHSYTHISDTVSVEINGHYARLFEFFLERPRVILKAPYRSVLLSHLPRILREHRKYRLRLKKLPVKYQAAILASEIASTIVYRGGFERNFEGDLKGYLHKMFP